MDDICQTKNMIPGPSQTEMTEQAAKEEPLLRNGEQYTVPVKSRNKHHSKFGVNKALIPLKMLFFFTIGGNGVINPFVPLLMKQLKLNSMETGIIFGAMPFLSSPVVPTVTALADKLGKPKFVLTLICILTGSAYSLLLAVPSKVPNVVCDANEEEFRLQPCELNPLIENVVCNYNATNNSSSAFLDQTYVERRNISDDTSIPEYGCSEGCLYLNLSAKMVSSESGVKIYKMSVVRCLGGHPSTSTFAISIVTSTKDNQTFCNVVNCSSGAHCLSSSFTSLKISFKVALNQELNTILSGNERLTSVCFLTCYHESACILKCDNEINCTPTYYEYDVTFWTASAVWLLCTVTLCSTYPLTNALAYKMIEQRGGDYGQHRAWGTVAYGVFGLLAGYVMDKISSPGYLNFLASSITFVVFMFTAALCSAFLKVNDELAVANKLLSKQIFHLVKIPEFDVLLFLVVCFGIMHSMVETFLFWYLEDLGSSELALGLCVAIKGVGEIVLFVFSKKLQDKIGHRRSIYIVLVAYFLRLFLYSVIPNAWYAVPVQLLHGVTFALMYSTVTSYGIKVAPQHLSATVQGLIGAFLQGLGGGIGNVLAGKLFQTDGGVGPVWTFRIFSAMALALLFLYILLNNTMFRNSPSSSLKKSADKSQV